MDKGGRRMAYKITENCTGCTACTKRCPVVAITGDRNLLHVIDPVTCIDCGACGYVCPDSAIHDETGELAAALKAKERPKAYVIEAACTGCEWCVDSCPFDALQMVESPQPDNFKGIVQVIDKKCVGCKLCEWDCPYEAIFVWRQDKVAPEVLAQITVSKAA